MLLPLIDGGIVSFDTDKEQFDGCESCDYGSSYIQEFHIETVQGVMYFKTDAMYEYSLSEGYLMETILPNIDNLKQMTEQEFYEWMVEQLKDKALCDHHYIKKE